MVIARGTKLIGEYGYSYISRVVFLQHSPVLIHGSFFVRNMFDNLLFLLELQWKYVTIHESKI